MYVQKVVHGIINQATDEETCMHLSIPGRRAYALRAYDDRYNGGRGPGGAGAATLHKQIAGEFVDRGGRRRAAVGGAPLADAACAAHTSAFRRRPDIVAYSPRPPGMSLALGNVIRHYTLLKRSRCRLFYNKLTEAPQQELGRVTVESETACGGRQRAAAGGAPAGAAAAGSRKRRRRRRRTPAPAGDLRTHSDTLLRVGAATRRHCSNASDLLFDNVHTRDDLCDVDGV
ncbi:hypothetical protein EVAR_17269_1 [Eumeta japonica]|uniref:Uncharacterized protein n=1 Tax=Eumeta variegata TaxID=151549 RepID=A0A4C1TTB2_EUMVA|nr:hypothetical protein EVAR_17269_1 [Eumeta japonica]